MFVVRSTRSSSRSSAFPSAFYMAAARFADRVRRDAVMFAKQQNRIDREHGYGEED